LPLEDAALVRASEVYYLVGLAKNERLNALSAKLQKRAYRKYQKTGSKVRLFTQFPVQG